jgi:hypothetical protein
MSELTFYFIMQQRGVLFFKPFYSYMMFLTIFQKTCMLTIPCVDATKPQVLWNWDVPQAAV